MSGRAVEEWPSPGEICRRYGFDANKNFGQNFLASSKAIREISSRFPLDCDCSVLEIGPGLGHLSFSLLRSGCELSALEIDERFRPVLGSLQALFPKFRVQFTDAMQADWKQYLDPEKNNYFFGNLPYYLSTELYLKAMTEYAEASGMAFLLQKEVIQRFTAPCGRKEYGPAAILSALYGKARYGSKVSGGAFYPSPDAESRILFLEADPASPYRALTEASRKGFLSFLRSAFLNKRKTLRNNLIRINPALADIHDDRISAMFARRPEQIEAEDWLILYNVYHEASKNE